MKELAEIVERFLVFALLPDDNVGPQPAQSAFIVEIRAAAP
jgi:hypothetical protein